MKLVATLGAPPPRATRKPSPAAKAAAIRKDPALAPPPPSPAAQAHAGRELLEAARTLLGELSRCARPA
jgi:hypothetical protein